jgi:hypothetical protein
MLDMGWPPDLTWYKLLTDWGGVIGGVFALIAGGAAYLAGRVQASATRSAADIQANATRQSAKEQVEAAQHAAEQQVATANAALGAHRETHRATQRAFVHLDGFNYELTTAAETRAADTIEMLPDAYRSQPNLYVTRFAFQPRWKNSGNTPTKNMVIQVGWRGPEGPMPPEYNYRNAPLPFFLAPNAVDVGEFTEIPSTQVLIYYGLHPNGAEPIFFLWGRADYKDVFGQDHFMNGATGFDTRVTEANVSVPPLSSGVTTIAPMRIQGASG